MAGWSPLDDVVPNKAEEEASPTWGDYGTAVKAGGYDVLGSLQAAGRYLTELSGDEGGQRYYKALGQINDLDTQDAVEGLSPAARKRLTAAVTSEDFWSHPVSATALKAARMTPTLAASIIPAVLLPGGGSVVAAGIGGSMTAAQTLDDLYQQIDEVPEDKLMEIPYYAGLRSMGKDETEARREYGAELRGHKPLLLFALGALTNAVGPAGQLSRVAKGGAASLTGTGGNIATRVGKGLAEGAASEFVEEGVQNAAVQEAGVRGGLQKEFDYGKFMDAALEGGLLGGLFGGVAGVPGGHGKSDTKKVPTTAPVEVLEPGTPSAEQQIALGNANTTPAGQATTPAPDAIPPDVAAAAARLQGGGGGQTMAREVGVPPRVQQASENLSGKVPQEVTAPADEEGGGFNINLPEELRPSQEDIDASQPEAEFPTAPAAAAPVVNPVVEKIKSRARAKKQAAAPVDALDVPADAGLEAPVDAPISESKPRVLRPVGEEEVDPDMVAKIQPVELPKEKGSVGSKDTKKLAKRQADAEATKALFDAADLPIEFPTSDQERQTLLAKVKELVDTIERNGVTIPAKTGYKDAKNPTPDHLVWARELKDLVGVLGKKAMGATKRTERDERVNAILANWKIAKDTNDFAPMRGERIASGAQKKSQAKGGRVDQIAAPVEEEVRASERDQAVQAETAPVMDAPALAEKDNDVVQTKVKGSAARGPELFDEERAAQVAPVKKVKITDELRKQYEQPPVTPKGKDAVEVVKTKAAAKRKPLPKPATAKAKIEAAAKDVNTAPSEAQKESGNYAKGHVNVQGLDVTLENPKGSKRTGKGPDGDWEVTMPAHYGYIKRTAGADGDQVDVYVGPKPDSPHVVIIDQNDLATGKFDEHKVMLGYDDGAAAVDAYEKAFSDGRGFDRIGKITSMSMDDFKAWLAKGDTKAPVDDLAHAKVPTGWERAELESDQELGPVNKGRIINQHTISVSGRTVTNLKGKRIVADFRTTLSGIMKHWVGKDKGGAIYNFLGERVMKMAGDTPVYVVTDQAMADYVGRDHTIPAGLATVDEAGNSVILLSRDYANQSTIAQIRHVIIHEGDHAVTMQAIRHDPRIMNASAWLLTVARRAEADMQEFLGTAEEAPYGLTNVYELVAEARSSAEFQRLLQNTLLTPEQQAEFKALLPEEGSESKLASLWDAFLAMVRHALRLPDTQETYNALEAAFELHKAAEIWRQDKKAVAAARKSDAAAKQASMQAPMHAFITDDVKRAFVGAVQQEQKSSPKLLKLASWNQIADAAESFFSAAKEGLNPVRVIYNLREARRVRAQQILQSSDAITVQSAKLEREFAGPKWEEFTSFLHDETAAGVFADKAIDDKTNSHIGKDSLDGAWSRKQRADLAERYAKLDPKLKEHRSALLTHYSAQQNQAALGLINNRVLTALGIEDKALAQRIFDGTETEADGDKVGKTALAAIKKAGVLSKLKGAYYPQARFGGYVVQGLYKITPPSNGKQIDSNTFEFTDRDAAKAYAEKQDARPTVRSVWVDKNTGKTVFEDEEGQVRVTKQDEDAVQRFRVKVQDRHVEFFDTQKEALQAAQEYEFPSDGSASAFREVKGVEPKRYEPGDLHSDMLGGDVVAMKRSLHAGEGYQGFTNEQKKELDRSIDELALRALGSNRIQSRRLPRRYVAGASRDATKTLASYNMSMAGYLAKLEYGPRLEAAHKELLEQTKNDASKNTSMGRRDIANEIEKRLYSDNAFGDRAGTPVALQRLLTLSFIDKLASPAYSIINATQTAMVAMPVIAGRHGVGASVTELSKAWNDISGFSVIKHGLGETGRAIQGKEHTATFLGDIKSRLKGNELKLIEDLESTGQIDGDAGLEVSALTRAQAGSTLSSQVLARADKGLGYVENIARQMPKAIEVMSRATTALAAYRLEMRKSGDHAKAVAYARQVVDQSQFNYSATNSAPIFNHPLGKLVFQFKKYGQNMYWLIGTNVAKAYRNESPGARTEAVRTLAMIAMTHMAMAGALGLPTEPFKYLLMGAKAFGLGTPGWDDVEELVRKYSAETLGKTGGEIFSKGLPRALGVDVSSRMGLDSLIAFGEPKSDKEKDVKTWLLDTIAGAPAGLVSDYIKGANNLMSGEYTKAAEKMVPLKFASDAIRAYRTASEGKKGETGRELMKPYSWSEAALRTTGFTPAREAEDGAKNAAFRNQTGKARDERSRIINAWVNAKGGAKVDAQRAVQKYNLKAAPENRIETKDLTSAAKRREREGSGIVTNKRTAPTKDRLDAIYQ